MPKKYHIHSKVTPLDLDYVYKFKIERGENCINCGKCTKVCIYEAHKRGKSDPRKMADPNTVVCRNCFRCIQECPRGALEKSLDKDFLNIGGSYWKSDMFITLWKQAEDGKVPVTGAGYRGPFSGPGFDSMWTDMSEIVRPTRDGIHGREYISTSVDIGRKLPYLAFNGDKNAANASPLVSIPMPMIIDMTSPAHTLPQLNSIIAQTAVNTDIIAIIDSRQWQGNDKQLENIAFYIADGEVIPKDALKKTRLVEIPDGGRVIERIKEIKKIHPGIVIAIRVELTSAGVERAIKLAESKEVEVIHIVADANGNEIGASKPRFIKDMTRQIHTALIEKGCRDSITLMAGGGIALPEHMAKEIICGADLITINLPLLISLECHLCNSCKPGMVCPAKLEKIDINYGVGRMTNLIAAWHDQLIEMMGAMGMREVRRLRGDVGRAMFFENLEEETFGKLFGSRKNN